MSRRSTALGLTVVIAGAVMALPLLLRKRRSRRSEDEALYETQLEQPAWAPPSYVFPIAWTASTISLAAAAQHLLLRPWHERRSELLAYLTAHTALYATFPRVYFDERSPVLAAAWTCADLLICHIAFYRALGVNRRVAAGFVPVNLWLTVAAPLSLYQAAANRDPIFGDFGVEVAEIVAGAIGVAPVGRR